MLHYLGELRCFNFFSFSILTRIREALMKATSALEKKAEHPRNTRNSITYTVSSINITPSSQDRLASQTVIVMKIGLFRSP